MERITHIRSRQTIVSWVIGVSSFLAFLLAGTVQANAATTTEYVGGNGSTFATGAGGWSNEADYAGVCIPLTHGITCPTVTGSFENSGGFDGAGDGFIRASESGTSLTALLASSSSIWTSPQFTYNGAGGAIPNSLEFGLKVKPSFAALLALGADATYTVDAVNRSGGSDVSLVDRTSVGSVSGWKSAPALQLGRNALTIGDKYQFVIATSVGGLAAVLPAGHVDYDNAVLTATSDASGGGGDGGGGGGGGGGTGTEVAPPKVIPNGVAYLYKGKLFVRERCPKGFKPKCRTKARVSRSKKGKAVTRTLRTSVKARTFKRAGLKVKRNWLNKVTKLSKSRKRTLWLTMHIKSKGGKKKGVVRHHLRVIHRLK